MEDLINARQPLHRSKWKDKLLTDMCIAEKHILTRGAAKTTLNRDTKKTILERRISLLWQDGFFSEVWAWAFIRWGGGVHK